MRTFEEDMNDLAYFLYMENAEKEYQEQNKQRYEQEEQANKQDENNNK